MFRQKLSFKKKLLSVLLALNLPISFNSAVAGNFTWTRYSNITVGQFWSAVISNDGNTILASSRTAVPQRSTNGGTSWSQISALSSGSYFFAMSSDGTKILATANESGGHYVSTDSGATWTSTSPGITPQYRPCISDNGQIMMIMPWNAIPKYSTNGGTTWSSVPGLTTNTWFTCQMSSDGQYIYAVNSGTSMYKSADAGQTWQSVAMGGSTQDVAVSADGSIVYVYLTTKVLKKSTNYGATFSTVSGIPTLTSGGSFISASGDGSKVLIFDKNSTIKTSVDGGNSWSTESSPPAGNFHAGDISTNGNKVVVPVATNGDYVWGSTVISPSSISLSSGNSEVLTFRTDNTITASANYAGKVTFYANGKKIGTCVSVPTNGSLIASCNYKPTIHGTVTITARLIPTNASYPAVTSKLFSTKISPRNTLR